MAATPTDLVKLEPHGELLVVRVASDQLTAVDVVDRFGERIRALLEQRSERRWLIDFASTVFLATPAVNTLLLASKRLQRDGGRLAICGLTPALRRLFGLMKLDRVLVICDGEEHGLAALKAE